MYPHSHRCLPDLRRDDFLLEKSQTCFKEFVLSKNKLLVLSAHHSHKTQFMAKVDEKQSWILGGVGIKGRLKSHFKMKRIQNVLAT